MPKPPTMAKIMRNLFDLVKAKIAKKVMATMMMTAMDLMRCFEFFFIEGIMALTCLPTSEKEVSPSSETG